MHEPHEHVLNFNIEAKSN